MTAVYEATLRVKATADTWFRWGGPAEGPEAALRFAHEACGLVWRAEARIALKHREPPDELKEEVEEISDRSERIYWMCGRAMAETLSSMGRENRPHTPERIRRRRLLALGLALSDNVLAQAYRDGLKAIVHINGRQGIGEKEVGSVAYACDERGAQVRRASAETQTIAKALGPWIEPEGQNRENALAILDFGEVKPQSATLRALCEPALRVDLPEALAALAEEVAKMGAPRLELECLRRIERLRTET